MKYRFSIIAPHPDDEFIGLRQFLITYGSNIDSVIFTTNGEHPITNFHDMIDIIQTRRKESETYLKKVAPQAQIIYLNVPDGLNMMNPEHNYGSDIFELVNGQSQFDYLVNRIRYLVGNNTILVPNLEAHPSHTFAYTLCQMLDNKKIYYSIHALMNKNAVKQPGVHVSRIRGLGEQYFNYYYILTDSELLRKKKEFQTYYNSQYLGFMETGLDIKNWESYLSEIPIKLADDDRTYRLEIGKLK